MSTPKNPAAADRSSLAIEHIHVARNVRDLCEEHVAMLAESIKLVGVLNRSSCARPLRATNSSRASTASPPPANCA